MKRLGLPKKPFVSTLTPTSSILIKPFETPDSKGTSSNDEVAREATSDTPSSGNDKSISMNSAPSKATSETLNSGNDKKRSMKSAATKATSKTTSSRNGDKRSMKSVTTKSIKSAATKTISETPNSRNRSLKSTATKAAWETPNSGNDKNLSIKSASNKSTSETPNPGKDKNLSRNSNFNETPVSSKPNKGAYKLSLCKSTTEAMTRKRILHQQSKSLMQPKRLKLELEQDEIDTEESNSVTRNEDCDTKASDECDKTRGENEPPSVSSLRNEIDELKKKIATTESYEQRSSELIGLITKWQEAGVRAINELKEKIDPLQDEEAILAHFHIDPGLFKLNFSE